MKLKKYISENESVKDTDTNASLITSKENSIKMEKNKKIMIISIIPIILILSLFLFKYNINYENLIYLTVHLILIITSFIYLDSNFQILNNFKFYKIKFININKPIVLKDLKLVLLTQKVLKNMKKNKQNNDENNDNDDDSEASGVKQEEDNIDDYYDYHDIEKKTKIFKRKSNSFDLRLPIITSSNNSRGSKNELVTTTATLPLPLFFGGGHHTRCFSESIPNRFSVKSNRIKERQNKNRYRNSTNRPLSFDDLDRINEGRDIYQCNNTMDLSFGKFESLHDTDSEEEDDQEQGNESYGSSLIDLIDFDFTKDEIEYDIENKNSNRNSYLSQLSNSSYSSYTDDDDVNGNEEIMSAAGIRENPVQFTITPKISMISIGIETIRGNDFEEQEQDLERIGQIENEFKSNNMYINKKNLKRNSMLFIDQDQDGDENDQDDEHDNINKYCNLNLRKLNLLKQL